MGKLLFVVNDFGYFLSHRLPIALAAKSAGFEVHVAYGGDRQGQEHIGDALSYHPIPLARGSMNPFRELRVLFVLWRLFLRLSPSLVHLVTIKPVLYGGIIARVAGTPAVVSAVAGLGFLSFRRKGIKAKLVRSVFLPVFRYSLRHPNQRVVFQNASDSKWAIKSAGLLKEKSVLIRGSGVDLDRFTARPETSNGAPVVAMASRLLREKGVKEFVQAACELQSRGHAARFWLVGEPDLENSDSVSVGEVAQWHADGVIEYLGYHRDISELYGQCSVIVLPSYYAEGLPKTLIEAAACGRAVVTTDMPGCRDAIVPGVSGLLVPPRNAIALANAIELLLVDIPLRTEMGVAGRQLAEREFGIQKVVASHLRIYQALTGV